MPSEKTFVFDSRLTERILQLNDNYKHPSLLIVLKFTILKFFADEL